MLHPMEEDSRPGDPHPACFVCGRDNPRGLHVRFDIAPDGAAETTWTPPDHLQSYPGTLHGGVVATLMDGAMVHALFARGTAALTAELNVRYLHPVTLHEPLRIRGWVEAERHGVFLCRAEASQSGHRVARASAKFMPPDPRATPAAGCHAGKPQPEPEHTR